MLPRPLIPPFLEEVATQHKGKVQLLWVEKAARLLTYTLLQ